MQTELINFNQTAKTQFEILNLGVSTYQNPLKRTMVILGGSFAGIFLLILLILLLESLRGIVSLPNQLLNYFQKEEILNLNPNNPDEIEFLATSCLNKTHLVILAGGDFDNSDQKLFGPVLPL